MAGGKDQQHACYAIRSVRRPTKLSDDGERLRRLPAHLAPIEPHLVDLPPPPPPPRPPDPHAALASNCIRDHLGPIAQTVADALHSRGPSTLAELISAIRVRCLRDWNSERGRLVDGLNSRVAVVDGGDCGNGNGNDDDDDDGDGAPHHRLTPRDVGGRASMNKARGSESAGYVTDTSHVRSALVALLHHSLVKVYGGGGGKGV